MFRPLNLLISVMALGLSIGSMSAHAAEIADGSTVRIRSSWIEPGWHTGRIKRDDRSCWTVQLDRPSDGGQQHVALAAVDALQLGRTGAWTAISAKQALATAPSHCFGEGLN